MNNLSVMTSPYSPRYNMTPVNRFRLAFTGNLKNPLINSNDVLEIFKNEITPKYRESGHCEEISDYLAQALKDEGFKVTQQKDGDGKGNIIATRNVDENKRNAIILQAHMDMVYASEDGNPKHAPEIIDDNKSNSISANKTSLGADDGIGVAMALAAARVKDEEFRKIPMQIIFTVDEETGLIGAKDIPSECIKGKYLINLDNGASDMIMNGCAGVADFDTNAEIPVSKLQNSPYEDYKKLVISLTNASGGHSGLDINKGGMNPIIAILKALGEFGDEVKLTKISGGQAINAIPSSATAEIVVPYNRFEEISKSLRKSFKAIKQNYKEPNLSIKVNPGPKINDSEIQVMDSEFQKKLIDTFTKDIKIGAISCSPGTRKPVTSQSLGILDVDGSKIKIAMRMRSNNSREMQEERKITQNLLSDLLDKEVKPSKLTNPWEAKENSKLTGITKEAFEEIQEISPVISSIHGANDCAAFADKNPDLDITSFGPKIEGMHTVKEKLCKKSVEPACNILETVVKNVYNTLINGKDKDSEISRLDRVA